MGFFQKLMKARKIRLEEEYNNGNSPNSLDNSNNKNQNLLNENNELIGIENKPINLEVINENQNMQFDTNDKLKTSDNAQTSKEEDVPVEAVNKNNFYSNLRTMINQVATEQNEKYENKIFYNFVYPMIDFFDSKSFNMQRLKSLDYLCEQKKINFNFKHFKQLTKEEKKAILTQVSETKTKYQEEKLEKINELKKPGNNFKYIKITKSNTFEEFLVNSDYYHEYDIKVARECIINEWNFPAFEFYEKISSNNIIKKQTKNYIEKNQIILEKDAQGYRCLALESADLAKLVNTESCANTPDRLDTSKNNINLITGKRRRTSIFADFLDKERNMLRNIYNNLIENKFEKYFIKKDVIIRKEKGYWIDIADYLSLFDNYIFLHNPKFYKFHIYVNKLWLNYEKDIYRPADIDSVFYINTNPIYKISKQKSNEEKENSLNEKRNYNFDNEEICESNNIFDDENFYSILLCFMTNGEKAQQMEYSHSSNNSTETDQNLLIQKQLIYENYIIFDFFLKNKNGKFELFEENMMLSSYYDVKQINYIEKEREYLLVIKGGLFPLGYTLNIYSDCFIESLSYQNYLETYLGYKKNIFDIRHGIIEAKKYFLLIKLKIKVNSNLYSTINIFALINI